MQQIKKIGRIKAMTQSEILCWIGANRAHPAHNWRHGHASLEIVIGQSVEFIPYSFSVHSFLGYLGNYLSP